MKTFLPATLLFSFSLTAAWSAASIEAAPESVTVYPDRAVVTRSATLPISAGIGEITFNHLPERLLDESLQVRAESAGGLTILDVRLATRHGRMRDPERLQPLLDKEKALKADIDQAVIEKTLLEQQTGFLSKAEAAVTAGRTSGEMPVPDEWRGLLRFFHETRKELLPRVREVEKELEKLGEDLEAVQREIAQTRGDRTRHKAAVVRVEAERDLPQARFILSHVIMNAGWNPVYNVRVDSASKGIVLDYEAMIRQQSGEDWNNVGLTLSTARPSLDGTPPELRPWVVDVRPPVTEPAPVARRAPAMMEGRFLERTALDFSDSPEVAGFASAAVETGLTAVHLRVPAASSIPADGQAHRVGVTSIPMEGEFTHLAVPKLSSHAFLRASVTHSGTVPLLPGRSTLFLDGNLTGQANLPRVEPGEEFHLPLGVDEAIRIERKLVRRVAETRGILSKTVRTHFEFETTLTNHRATRETLVIHDQIPVSRQERIRVETVDLSGGELDEDGSGLVKWRRSLAPGESAVIKLSFRVEHPEEMDVTGL